MKSPAGTVTLVPMAAVMIHTMVDTGSAKKIPAVLRAETRIEGHWLGAHG